MKVADAPFKRLRFEYVPDPRESLVGALAAACRQHRLHDIPTALEGGGIQMPRTGLIQCTGPDTIERLARIMRTESENLHAIAFAPTDQRRLVALADLQAPRRFFDFERRRIAPQSLQAKPYHRSDWLNRLLPYCPESLELLVDVCPVCGPLGWRHTRGIAACEKCGDPIPPSSEDPLPVASADDYRLFADLMSRNPDIGQNAVQQLPDAMQAFSRTALVNVALKAAVISSLEFSGRGVDRLLSADAAIVADVVGRGAALLRGWPASIRSFTDARLGEIAGNVAAYDAMRRDIRWIAQRSVAEEQQLVAMAFPDIDGRKVKTFAKDVRYYTATETNTLLWTSSRQLEQLRKSAALRWEELPGGLRKRVRYDADDVDELRRILRNSVSPEAVGARFELPVYAIGQMIALELLEAHDHAGAVILQGQQLRTGSVDDFARHLHATAIRQTPPAGFVPLRSAMMRFPGEKPWARVLKAMRDRHIPFYVEGTQGATTRNMHVNPARLPRAPLSQTERGDEILILTHVAIRDACEILGLGFEETANATASAKIEIIRRKKGKGVARDDLVNLAASIASTGEAAAFSNRNAVELYHELKRLGVTRLHDAWCRRSLVELGLVNDMCRTLLDRCRGDGDGDALAPDL